jgi:prepilin-type processing-associated H-X9-DG protein
MNGNPEDAGYTGGANFAYCDGHAGFAKLIIGGDIVYPSPAQDGGLEAGWYSKAKMFNDVGVGTENCPDRDMTAFEANH